MYSFNFADWSWMSKHNFTVKYDGNIHATNKNICLCIIPPHSGNGFKWILRASPLASFDRWANSTAFEEFFYTSDALASWLESNYVLVLEYCINMLSDDYIELKGEEDYEY